MKTGKQGESRRRTGSKKPYHAPKLTVHGDIRTLTRAKGGNRSDGGAKPKTKTTGTA